MTYRSEADAFRRAEILRRDWGIWPGVRRQGPGWVLTCDPLMSGIGMAIGGQSGQDDFPCPRLPQR